MTRKVSKFSLEVEQVLNMISEPEYREVVIEALTFIGHLDKLVVGESRIPTDRVFEVEQVIYHANRLFVEHNVSLCHVPSKGFCTNSKLPEGNGHNRSRVLFRWETMRWSSI